MIADAHRAALQISIAPRRARTGAPQRAIAIRAIPCASQGGQAEDALSMGLPAMPFQTFRASSAAAYRCGGLR
jgi:hypothetical protein